MNGDFQIVAPTILTARAASKVTDVYMYQFSRVAPSTRRPLGEPPTPPKSRMSSTTRMGTFRSSRRSTAPCRERWPTRGCSLPKPEIQTVRALPQWPAYRSPDYRLLDFGDRVTVRSNARSPQVDFYQRVFDTMRRTPPTSAGVFQQAASPAVNPAQEPPIRTGAAPVPNCELRGPLIRIPSRSARDGVQVRCATGDPPIS